MRYASLAIILVIIPFTIRLQKYEQYSILQKNILLILWKMCIFAIEFET